ncbi:hypothetical protein [Holospora elegans]|nr:hypothetical protein [Holospora elegans]
MSVLQEEKVKKKAKHRRSSFDGPPNISKNAAHTFTSKVPA